MYAERASIKKKKRHPHTVTNWLFVQTTHVALSESKFACRVASGVYSSINQVLLKTVQWFCRCGWSKIALSHYFGHWLIQQAVIIILFYYYYCCFYLLLLLLLLLLLYTAELLHFLISVSHHLHHVVNLLPVTSIFLQCPVSHTINISHTLALLST